MQSLEQKRKEGLADDSVIEVNINSFNMLNYFILPKCWGGCLGSLQNFVGPRRNPYVSSVILP